MAQDHQHSTEGVSDRALLIAVAANIGLSGFEVVAGAITGSVALMADALHNFNDCAALFIAYVARRISRRGANERFTFSYRRAELIGAMINLTALILVGAYLVYEAIQRFINPEELSGGWIMAAAGVALVVDVITAWLLWALSKGSMNVRAAFVHNLTDALASVAVLVGGAAVYFLGWNWVDPSITLGIAGYILYLSVGMLKRTATILMEGTPEGLRLEDIARAVRSLDEVVDLHHLHVWELDEQHRAMEGHVVVRPEDLVHLERIKSAIKRRVREEFQIVHSTLEFELPNEACDERRLVPEHT